MTICHLIVDPPAVGSWNMAVDEALLVDAAETGTATLRFYQWSEPTLSLGYFQRLADRDEFLRLADRDGHAASRNCAVVRRQSGGGAILHDRELTYSLALPTSDRRAASAEQLYVLVHDAIITALADGKSCGATPFSLARWDGPSATRMADEPFLCFQRRSAGDVVATRPGDAKNHKIVGSAQRRRRGALLQHGSVLLETSPAAPELAGIRELTDLRTNADKLAELLAVRIPTALGENFQPVKLSCDLKIAAEEIQRSKYDRAGWLTRR